MLVICEDKRWVGGGHTVGVDNGEDVKVKLVTDGTDGGVGGVLGEEVVGDVLDDLGADPLAGVDGAVEVDGGLGALAAGAPDVNAEDVTALERLADGEDLGSVGERRLQVVEKGDVVGVRVVRVEPGQAGDSLGTDAFLFVRTWKPFRKETSRRAKHTVVGGKGTLLGDISTEILVHELGLETEGLKGSDLLGRDGNVEVLIVVEVEGDGGKPGEFFLDGGRVMMGGNAVGLVPIIIHLALELGSGGGRNQRGGTSQKADGG